MTPASSPQLPARRLNDLQIVRWWYGMGIFWLLWSIIHGLFYSFQFLGDWFIPAAELFSPGRLRMIHTNTVAYGFIASGLIGSIHYVIPRLTRQPVLSESLNRIVFALWQGMVGLTYVGILFGQAQGIEWGETPIFVDPLVAIAWVLLVVNLATPIIRSHQKNMYVSLWYFSAAFVWTALTYLMGNYLPQFFIAGSGGGAIAGLFIHDLVGLFVTPLGWGLMYYFVPIILKKPVWSHGLSLVGFWGLAFFYPLNGIHHFLYSPIPMYLQYGAVLSTIAVEFVVTTVIINFHGTLWGRGHMLRENMPIRWFYVGMLFYFLTCLQCSFQTTMTFQKIIHFTDWVVGHAHMVMFGVFGFWIFGIMTYLWPKLCGTRWAHPRLLGWHFWITVVALAVMIIDLTIAGLVQGYMWASLAPWVDTLVASRPFWWVRMISGTFIVGAQCVFAYEMAATWSMGRARAFVPHPEPHEVPQLDGTVTAGAEE